MTRRRPLGDRGSVTAELAVALPAVAVLLLVVLGAVHAVSVRWECADGARAGARSAALGESDAVVVQTARRAAGGSAAVDVVRDGEWVTVTVARGATGWDSVPLDVQAHAVARSEP
ncbi:TadE family type IV pilus minor pilin [Cellulomonas soli]|uniref:TadE family type IV pilus minor pilin n=1 Tax=Cellulomonas soli TaxID=931535 RepID=UPI003F830205